MPKDPDGDSATKKRKENNYRAKKQSKSTDAKESHALESLDAGIPTNTVTEAQKPTHDCTPPRDVQQSAAKPLPTPLDASIPFKTQFGIVTAVQGWLEEAIFDFFRKWLPEVLEAKDIDIAEKVELTDWADTIGKEIKALPKAATDRIPGTSLMQELRATYQLRNAALRRQQLSSIRLLELLGAASNLVTIMKDEKKIALIGALVGEIQAASRVLETRLEATKEAIIHDFDIIENMKNRLNEQMMKVKKAAGARCERNRKGVGITLDLFLDNTRKGSTRGGQMAIFEDELMRLQESQETLLPQDFQSRYASLFQTGSLQISSSVKPSAEDLEKGGINRGKEGGKEDAREDSKGDVAILGKNWSHPVGGKAQIQRAHKADRSSTDTSSALEVPGHAEDRREYFKDHPKAVIPLAQDLTSKLDSSESPMQPGINRFSPFMASNSKSRNLEKGQLRDTLDVVSDATFTFKVELPKATVNAPSTVSKDRSREPEPIFTSLQPFKSLSLSSDPVPTLSSSQRLFAQQNERATETTSSQPSVASTTTDSTDPALARIIRPLNSTKKVDLTKGDQKQGSGSLPSLFTTAQNNPTSSVSASSKKKQAAVSSAAASSPKSDTAQHNTTLDKPPHPNAALLPQAPSSFSGFETSPANPPSAPSTQNFKFTRPMISPITRCFGTAKSLPFNPLYTTEQETRFDGRIVDHIFISQSITFMMGHRNYSFEVCHIAVHAWALFFCANLRRADADHIQGTTTSRLSARLGQEGEDCAEIDREGRNAWCFPVVVGEKWGWFGRWLSVMGYVLLILHSFHK